jgi:hypothetical protein
MNKVITTFLGGHPFTLDDIRYNDDAYRDAFNNILGAFGTNLIVSGCAVNDTNISAGYVSLNGELLKVDAHTRTGDYYQKITSYDPTVRIYKNGIPRQPYQINRAVCSAGAGPLAYNGRRLFGNGAEQACEGNDARLSNSRQCNNNFDNAATSRQNLVVYSKEETGTQIENAINALINGAPGALDTLNELATALGGDKDFSTTVLNQLALKANKDDTYIIGATELTIVTAENNLVSKVAPKNKTYHILNSTSNHLTTNILYTLNADSKIAFIKIQGEAQGHFFPTIQTSNYKTLYSVGGEGIVNNVPIYLKFEKTCNDGDYWAMTVINTII